MCLLDAKAGISNQGFLESHMDHICYFWGALSNPFFAITPRTNLYLVDNTCKDLIYGSCRTVQSFTKDYY